MPVTLRLPEDRVKRYMLAGDSTFTVVGPNKRMTFRITEADDGGCYFVSAIRSPNHDRNWYFLGCIFDKERFMPSRKYRYRADTEEFKAFNWLWYRTNNGGLPPEISIMQSDKCTRCGALLTTPESIERGVGPVCAKKAGWS